MITEPTAYNNDSGSWSFSIGMLGDARHPQQLALCPVCHGTDAVDQGGVMVRCNITHDLAVAGVRYVTAEFAEDWRMDLAEKCADNPLVLNGEDGSWLA